jgi:hypothetical protein
MSLLACHVSARATSAGAPVNVTARLVPAPSEKNRMAVKARIAADVRLMDVQYVCATYTLRMGTGMVKKPRMRVTLYLPDELREQANKAGLNLSRLLREAVERELHSEAPGIRSSGRRVKQSVELTVSVPIETIRGLIDEDIA